MNKQQKRERREARETKEAGKRFNSLQELDKAMTNGEVKLSENPAPATINAPVAVEPKKTANPGKKPAAAEATTKAGVREYNDFFGLYAKSIRDKKPFRSLGFIPGPAVILDFREGGDVRVLAATSDVAQGLGTVPTPWMAWEALPEKIRQALAESKAVVDGLGYDPSPYNLGLAKGLLVGRAPGKYLAMVMPRFRYRPGDPEKPFGVTLLPVTEGGELKGLKAKIFSPKGVPDAPADGTVLTLSELKDGKGPVQKLIRTWALMEENYLGRYDRDGNRLQQKPQPRAQR